VWHTCLTGLPLVSRYAFRRPNSRGSDVWPEAC
jgi:hypothetical protein